MSDFNRQQWNQGEFQSPYVIATATVSGTSSAACQVRVRKHVGGATQGASSAAASAIRRRQIQPATVGTASAAAAVCRRRVPAITTAGTSTSSVGVIRRKLVNPFGRRNLCQRRNRTAAPARVRSLRWYLIGNMRALDH